jgi:hypothetical protein
MERPYVVIVEYTVHSARRLFASITHDLPFQQLKHLPPGLGNRLLDRQRPPIRPPPNRCCADTI